MKGYGKQLLTIYGINDRDWMNFKISKKNPLTYHHIDKRENGGKSKTNNGALLTKKAHIFLHCIEHNNIEMYNQLNYYFKIINSNQELTLATMDLIKKIILEYLETEYSLPKNLNSEKIKNLIA